VSFVVYRSFLVRWETDPQPIPFLSHRRSPAVQSHRANNTALAH